MKIIFIFLFSLVSFIKSSNIYEIELNTEYTLSLKTYEDNYIPGKSINFFKISVEDDISGIDFQLKVLRGKQYLFKVFACGYDEDPTEVEIVNENENCSDFLKCSVNKEGIFEIYEYSIEKTENVKYLSFLVYNEYDVDYLSVVAKGNYPIKYKMYDITYMKELELKNDILEKHEGIFVFSLKNENRKISSIKLKTKTEITSDIFIKVTGYKEKPNSLFDIAGHVFLQEPRLKSVTNDEEYYIYEYEYDFEKIDDIGYLCVFFLVNEKLDYLSIFVGK
jgi:hypothetical protein